MHSIELQDSINPIRIDEIVIGEVRTRAALLTF